jgi:predicted MFS family arabinose efflux permease
MRTSSLSCGARFMGNKVSFMLNLDQSVEGVRPDRRVVVAALGVTQIFAWGSTFYLLGVLANPISRDTGWSYDWVVSGISVGLLMAGMISPRVGRAINRRGGRLTLALSAILLAGGLLLLGSSQDIAWYLMAWLLVGAGMGSGLTDAAFSTLGSIYGEDARNPITSLTLFAGFASTVCWPLSAYLVDHLGWRGTCFVYAAVQIGVALPILLVALPRSSFVASPPGDKRARLRATLAPGELTIFGLLAIVLTLSAAILSMVGVHLLPLLQARGVDLPVAVALGALVGPAQVGARIVEMLAGRHYHPIWTMIFSAVLVAGGISLLFVDFPVYFIAIVLYGAGNGIGSVARGTLPLAIFGPSRYPTLIGLLAFPILVSMALSPFLGAIAFQAGGANLVFGILALLGVGNVFLVALLRILSKGRPTGVETD